MTEETLKETLAQAVWICHPDDGEDHPLVPVFKKAFTVKQGLRRGRLTLTAHGIYEAKINGKAVTEDRFTPGLTSYYYRLQVQQYDVTGLLHPGENRWETTVGDGWWRWNNNFGYRLAMVGALELVYEDGSREVIGTDETFSATTGPIRRTDLQAGEYYDARVEGRDVPGKCAVRETDHIDGKLIPTEGVPVREKERFSGKIFRDTAGNTVIDFGQNIAGYVHMKLYHTSPGQVVRLKHGEGLDLEGAFATANCDGGREHFQEITYICKGCAEEEYTPHFAVFGFRYALLTGIEGGDFTAVAVYSDMEETGDFQCSNPLINRLVENARWSQKGNFLDVAVDCPTRERNAWTGDAQIYVRTAAYFMNVRKFFRKWLADQRIEQYGSGKVGITFPATSSVHNPKELEKVREKNPAMALAGPTGNGNIGEDSVGWGDAAVWLPYQLYLMYGDRSFLKDHYETARRWVEYSLSCMRETNPIYADKPWYAEGNGQYIYDTRFHYGEWNEPLMPDPKTIAFFQSGKSPVEWVAYMAQFGKPEVATAYTKRSCDNLAHMAAILGKKEDAKRYGELAGKIRKAYNRYLIGPDGEIQRGHQAAYIRALALDLADEEKKPLVIKQLRRELEEADYHLNTGFLSTVYLLPTLCENGLVEEAYRILEQTSLPGWLHPVTLGATTIPENWDGFDRFRDSFNHYSFGAVCQFLFEYTAGIRPSFEGPGFRKFRLEPVVGGSLTWAKASYQTQYGTITSSWERKEGRFRYQCSVPEDTKAELVLPDGQRKTLGPGQYSYEIFL